ncbi:MAG: hypothetical protein HC888_01080 [Candidatus Competibacteraceae bacterium]|nr:hypothetical protein [Candidatus Competibacteraceae bacterium]
MEIYIGDGEYADAPGDDPADAYDAWLEKISEDEDYVDEQRLGSDDDDWYDEGDDG